MLSVIDGLDYSYIAHFNKACCLIFRGTSLVITLIRCPLIVRSVYYLNQTWVFVKELITELKWHLVCFGLSVLILDFIARGGIRLAHTRGHTGSSSHILDISKG